jgi:hypothetical protein
MAVMPRTIKQGSVELVFALVVDITGADISDAVCEVAHVLYANRRDDPSTYPWETPHAESDAPSDSVRRVAKLVTAELVDEARTKYEVFVRMTDNPEIPIIDCGSYTIVP